MRTVNKLPKVVGGKLLVSLPARVNAMVDVPAILTKGTTHQPSSKQFSMKNKSPRSLNLLENAFQQLQSLTEDGADHLAKRAPDKRLQGIDQEVADFRNDGQRRFGRLERTSGTRFDQLENTWVAVFQFFQRVLPSARQGAADHRDTGGVDDDTLDAVGEPSDEDEL